MQLLIGSVNLFFCSYLHAFHSVCMFVFQCLYICISVSVCLYFSVCMFVFQCLYICISVSVYLYFSVCMSVFQCLYFSICISVYQCLYICISVYVCLYFSVCMSVFQCLYFCISVFNMIAQPDNHNLMRDCAPKIRAPTQLVWGEEDMVKHCFSKIFNWKFSCLDNA